MSDAAQPRSPAGHFLALATILLQKKDKVRALRMARQALAASGGDPETALVARHLLSSLIPRYHFPMMNDARRNVAWDLAIRKAVAAGHRRILDIGTGAGMLALMAARAGAEKVVTCELDPVLAELARELMERNRYSSVVEVVAARSQDLRLGEHLQEPADLLICDIFADDLIGFDPLPALADARRLLLPGAPVIPASGAIQVALCHWGGYKRHRAAMAAGFDISPLADLTPATIRLRVGFPDVRLRSESVEAFRFGFDAAEYPAEGTTMMALEATESGEVNGMVQWIKLQLDDEVALEARPEPGATFFSSPNFYPLPEPVLMKCGDTLRATASHSGNRLLLWA